jgi:hypothetical protein
MPFDESDLKYVRTCSRVASASDTSEVPSNITTWLAYCARVSGRYEIGNRAWIWRDRESSSLSIAFGIVGVLYMYTTMFVNKTVPTKLDVEHPFGASRSARNADAADASDARVRAILKSSWLGARAPLTVLDEVGLFRRESRVDLVVVGDRLEAYEIKSAADSLTRLPAQVHSYSRVFERITLVCASRHVARALAIVPEWWTVLEVVSSPDSPFICRQDGRDNPEIDPLAVAQLLWRDDALDALARRDRAAGLWTSTRTVIWRALSEAVPPAELLDEARAFFRRRAARPSALASA